jgi:hypothetical protein
MSTTALRLPYWPMCSSASPLGAERRKPTVGKINIPNAVQVEPSLWQRSSIWQTPLAGSFVIACLKEFGRICDAHRHGDEAMDHAQALLYLEQASLLRTDARIIDEDDRTEDLDAGL